MTSKGETNDRRQVLQQALRAIDDLQGRLDAAEAARKSPVAVIGIGCRYPGGAKGPEGYWRLLRDGIDAVAEVPAGRWDINAWCDPDRSAPGKSISRWGGFLEDIDQFDPHFFAIAPREALLLDPQQRLLLEVAWEALESAGQAPDRLAGTPTGVFIGISHSEYHQLLSRRLRPAELDAYITTGNGNHTAAGRLSFFLGLHGPCLAIDTACSSSLVAVHQAVQALRNGECSLALAGGVNVVLSPDTSVSLSKWGMLSADGRCKAFDAAADGFVRGEGCGLVVLKRLSDALTARDNILAVIRGTAINHDGKSSGLTVPNGLAQQAVLRQALANAGVSPAQVGYIETHGTGTSLGDPIEVEALGIVFGGGRAPENRLKIGSVKTNFGHTESASGVAGLIKAILALYHEEVPGQLHLKTLTPEVPWDRIPLDVVTRRTPWPRAEHPRLAGVSSFGASGTNAHVVLGEAPLAAPPAPEVERPRHLLTISARTETALRELTGRYARHFADHPELPLSSVCFTANTGRAHFSHRLALSAATPEEMRQQLAEAARSVPASGRPAAGTPRPRIAFLFTGQGSQYAGMGRQLYLTQPTFRKALDQCAELLRPHLDRPLLEVLFPSPGQKPPLNQTAYAQPALFALEWSLARLWQSWGVEPFAVLGHSVGEYAAACLAGVFSLEDGLRLIATRGRLMQALPEGGVMAAVRASEASVRRALTAAGGLAEIACLNGLEDMVISGTAAAVRRALAELHAEGAPSTLLNVSHAFHSPLMEPMLGAFFQAASEVRYSPPRIPVVSNLTGSIARGEEISTAEYWRRHVRQPVHFAAGMAELGRKGCDIFLEIGPAPTLLAMGRRCLPDRGAAWAPSLCPDREDWTQLLATLGEVYVRGSEINWAGFDSDYPRCRVALPTYPFERRRYWVDASAPSAEASAGHPLLGPASRSPLVKEVFFSRQLSLNAFPFLRDHVVAGQVIVPMTVYMEMALAGGTELFWSACPTGAAGEDRLKAELQQVVLREPLVLREQEVREVQLVLTPDGSGTASFQVVSLDGNRVTAAAWTVHATGSISVNTPANNGLPSPTPEMDLPALRDNCAEELSADALYHRFEERRICFGPCFRGARRVWRSGEGVAVGEVVLPESLRTIAGEFLFHPAFLDACLHPLEATFPREAGEATFLPLRVESLRLFALPPGMVISYARRRPGSLSPDTFVFDIDLFNESGHRIAEVKGLLARRTGPQHLQQADAARPEDCLYEVVWRELPRPSPVAEERADYLPSPNRLAEVLSTRLPHHAAASGIGEYAKLLAFLEQKSLWYVRQAMRQLGWVPATGNRVAVDQLAVQLGIVERHRRLLGRLLEVLEEAGDLAKAPTGWEVRAPGPGWSGASNGAELHPLELATATELKLLGRCGERLADVLRGSCDPLGLLFSPESARDLETLYRDAPVSGALNRLVADAFAAMVAALPAGRKLRVVEIGAGTGGTTAHVLPHLPPDRTDYLFTDVSPLFTARAAEALADFPFLRFAVLDIEQPPVPQRLGGQSFDVVLAANVIHATADLRQSLRHALELLAPGGLLILQEGTRPQRWIDLTFGLTEGWWKFTDYDRRPAYPLIRASDWLAILQEMGLQNAQAIPGPDATGPLAGHAILLARSSGVNHLPSAYPGPWLLFADRGGVAEKIAAELRARGRSCVLVAPGDTFEALGPEAFRIRPQCSEDYAWLLREVPECQGVVHLWSLDDPPAGALTTEGVWRAQERSCRSALSLAQAVAGCRAAHPPRLWLCTRGAQAVDGVSAAAVPESTVWGLGKIIALEHPELRCTRLDLDPAPVGTEAAEVCAALLQGDSEDQIAYRNGVRQVPRLVRYAPQTEEQPVQLENTTPGRLDGLTLRPLERRQPQGGEVEVRVAAVGLNFRDVLGALALYPGEAGPLGGEVVGTVTAIGPGVKGLSLGDAVAALAPGGLRSYVTTRAELVMHKPPTCSFAQAATIPAAFLTAYYSLHRLGKMRRGERVLIHAAAGGVGLAAGQLAQRCGCEVFATAGSRRKRAFLESLGIPHVLDSRSLSFADDVRRLTGGAGVDLVLNCLSGDFIPASLSILQPHGRFLEIGKRDIWDAGRVASVRPHAFYAVVDVAALSQNDPGQVHSLLAEVSALLEQGTIRPLPHQVFPRAEVQTAFRHMAQAKHIGKIVVEFDGPPVSPTRQRWTAPSPPTPLPQDERGASQRGSRPVSTGTCLITGGLGGLGLRVAQWLAENGALHLALMARSQPSAEAREAIAALEKVGVQVLVCQGDVSRGEDVERALAAIAASLPPLRGVIHSAGVLDDGAVLQQTWDRFVTVLAPKVAGAWHLHRATRNLPLDFFILFSSASALLGSPGQSNHAAANAFLDALAHHRRALGLPGLSINWGVWSEIGAAARRDVGRQVETRGIGILRPLDGIRLLQRLMGDNAIQAGAVAVDWPRFLGTLPPGGPRQFFAELAAPATGPRPEQKGAVAGDWKARLRQAPPRERRKLFQVFLREQVVKVLGLAPSFSLSPHQGLRDLGIDSLMSLELKNRLQAVADQPLPPTLIFDYPTVAALVDYFGRHVLEMDEAVPSDPLSRSSAGNGGRSTTELDNLSEEEAEALLLEELRASQPSSQS
jgi:acyl transferase domain-containing protein/NADPH:quinone reductase-like Zn-dependent oxidoreductase